MVPEIICRVARFSDLGRRFSAKKWLVATWRHSGNLAMFGYFLVPITQGWVVTRGFQCMLPKWGNIP